MLICLQVGVPLTILILASMGVRSYIEVVILFLILSATVNTLWLQSILQGSALYLAKSLTVTVPFICIYMTSYELLGWEHITVFMTSISLAPLLIMPVIINGSALDSEEVTGGATLDKFQLRLGFLCSSSALLCTIINLAML